MDPTISPELESLSDRGGCRLLGTQPSSSSRGTEEALEPGQAHVCIHPECKSNKNPTFSRSYNLERHMKGHAPTRPLACHAASCESKGQNGYYREDKFYKHIREHHDVDTEWTCPEKHCSIEPMCADELISHLVQAHGSDFKLWRFYHYVAVLPVTVPDKLMCPLGDCTIPIIRYHQPPVTLRIRMVLSLQGHLDAVHGCQFATELATILSDGESFIEEVDISEFKKGNGVCPVCQTDALAWNGHNLGDHMRQLHGPDAVYACEPDIRNQECFFNGNCNNQKFVDQFSELLFDEEVQNMPGSQKLMKDLAGETHLILANRETPALKRGWVPL